MIYRDGMYGKGDLWGFLGVGEERDAVGGQGERSGERIMGQGAKVMLGGWNQVRVKDRGRCWWERERTDGSERIVGDDDAGEDRDR